MQATLAKRVFEMFEFATDASGRFILCENGFIREAADGEHLKAVVIRNQAAVVSLRSNKTVNRVGRNEFSFDPSVFPLVARVMKPRRLRAISQQTGVSQSCQEDV